jgi:hypothetical protein
MTETADAGRAGYTEAQHRFVMAGVDPAIRGAGCAAFDDLGDAAAALLYGQSFQWRA